MKVLIVKLTSMGDLIHTLPAISDASRAIPGIQFDWVADKAFAEIPSWHPNVNKVIKSAHRKWKKNKWASLRNGDISTFLKTLRSNRYDLIIDAQSSFKSAIIARLAKGARAGMDKHSVKEKGAQLLYRHRYAIAKKQHAITRLRQLFANALGYALDESDAAFSINTTTLSKPTLPLAENYFVFIHSTTWETKIWPENYWHYLIDQAAKNNTSVLLPWGGADEKARAERLAAPHKNAMVLPRLSLSELAVIISNAKKVVSVDTGLGHLAAALDIPAIHLYGPTDPALIGATGKFQTHLTSSLACSPCYLKRCNYATETVEKPACFMDIRPERVQQYL